MVVLSMLLAGCATADDSVDPLPAGAGLFFTTGGGGDAIFIQLDEITGATDVHFPEEDGPRCPQLEAMDTRADGMVVAVGASTPAAYHADPRANSRCARRASLPEVMRSLAVHPDGRMFMVSADPDAQTLYELNASFGLIGSVPIGCPQGPATCFVSGIDLAPSGDLYAITLADEWGTIDRQSGIFGVVASVPLRDDVDIDAAGTVRGLAGGEYRVFDLAGAPVSAINVEGGTTLATGFINR